ncbi:MAG TPA: hypothetical protein VNL71_01045 [Chloroflexota bacterium]|nr:hypothetical protein [Chloroflexota bacterium]
MHRRWSAILTSLACLVATLPIQPARSAPAHTASALSVQWSGSGSEIATLSLANVSGAADGSISVDLAIANHKSVYYNLSFAAAGGVTDQVGGSNLLDTVQRSARRLGAPATLFPIAGNSTVTLIHVVFPPRTSLTVRFAKFGDGPRLAAAIGTLDLVMLLARSTSVPDPGQVLSGHDDVAFATALLATLQRAGLNLAAFGDQVEGGDIMGGLQTVAEAAGRAGPALESLLPIGEHALSSLVHDPGAILHSLDFNLLPVLYDLASAPMAGGFTITNPNSGDTLPVPPPAVAGGAAIVLIPGVLSQTGDGTFGQFQSLVSEDLRHTPLARAAFLRYSYTGGSFAQPGNYGCQDTFDHSLQADESRLNDLITGYLAQHPRTTFYLIGHSQGGLIAFSYLAYLKAKRSPAWTLPNGGALRGVATVDAPVGGIPNAIGLSLASDYYGVVCPAMSTPVNLPFTSLVQMYGIAGSAPAAAHPRGGQTSVAGVLYGHGVTNQNLADEAARHGIHVLTVGNTFDYTFAPCPTMLNVSDADIDTQWLAESAKAGLPVYGRAVALGSTECSIPSLADNHGLALGNRDSNGHGYADPVPGAVARFLTGAAPDPLTLPLADLVVDAAAQPMPGVLGSRFTVVLRNLGGQPASGRLLRDTVSGAGSIISVTSSGMVCAAADLAVSCTGTLPVYGTASLVIDASASLTGGAITNLATANPEHTIPVLERAHARVRTVGMVR